MKKEMAKVFVFHYTETGILPKLSEKELRDTMKGFYEVLKGYPDVKFNGTYVRRRERDGDLRLEGSECGCCERDSEESAGSPTYRLYDCGEEGFVG